MGLRIIGAGLGRTGTTSVKLALEELLGGRCYHMSEVRERPEDSDVWGDAYEGRLPNWEAFFDGYEAAVDWPSAPFWRELSVAFPDAPILLSVRDADAWWKSVSNTIFIALATYFAPDAPGRWLDPHGSGDDDELHPRLAERGSRQSGISRLQQPRTRYGSVPSPGRMESGRWLGAHLPGSRTEGASRAVPAREHHESSEGRTRTRRIVGHQC